jgi:hypothetical protein
MTEPDQPSLAERARTVVSLSTAATMITGRCGVAPSGRSRRDLVLSPLSARFYGTTSVLVPMSEYLEASPDPLARHAAGTVRHLEGCHGRTVLDAVRRQHRPHALAAVPRSLTRFGLEVGVLSADGVETLWLRFPEGPVAGVHEASAALRGLLTGTPSGVSRDREQER